MLKLLQNSARTKSVIPFISTQNAQFSSDDKRSRRDRLLLLRAAQKKLYGSVVRDVSVIPQGTIRNINYQNQVRSDHEEPSPFEMPIVKEKVPNVKLVDKQMTNELLWLSQTSNVKILKMKSSRGNSTKAENFSSDYDDSDESRPKMTANLDKSSGQSATGGILTAKGLIQQLVTSTQSNDNKHQSQPIPFNDSTLKSIVSYPLICEKMSHSQVHKVLDDKSIPIPSISKVLQATMPESARIALRKWKLSKIAELGLDGFKQYEQQTLGIGKDFHLAIEKFLISGTVPMPDSHLIKLWQSIDNSLNELQPKPVLLEQPIIHAELKYKGIIDNVSIVRNELCAFEWKTSEKSKPRITSTYDAPVQLCAYLGALNADPRYDMTVKNGRVVVAYKNGDTANVFNLSEADLRKYWLQWLQRLQEYWIRVKDGTLPDPI
ncbi:mitochondrial genome maintenance exonuclease 1-like [Contarinia nasturtii]|uniref:mitochondrial genome maintenance exonuclease 1-like n=1 Tax=Contarinia nasturtii TaxID=265458 RepID=UPI0012D3DC91|nr:mitochondrial genome maintenance exonuclease 1-like [Contarinia nasturtii]